MLGHPAHSTHTAYAGDARAAVVADRVRVLAGNRWLVNCSFMGITVKPGQPRRLRASTP
jgi:hypothetical protein